MNGIVNVFRVALLLLTIVGLNKAFAWGDDGHRVVGEIAWHYLEPQVAGEIQLLLQRANEPDLAESATWADRIRSNKRYNWAAPMHYINLSKEWTSYVEARDCPAAGCILKAIKQFSQILGDRNRKPEERAEALMFIAHFVGDLHQPLHTGLYSDKGGNDIQVQFLGIDTNLHALWDIHLVSRIVSDWHSYAREQTEKISTAQRRLWQSTTEAQWAQESHQLAHKLAYTSEYELGEKYFLRCQESVEMRLRQGGVRLAAVLNRALGEGGINIADN